MLSTHLFKDYFAYVKCLFMIVYRCIYKLLMSEVLFSSNVTNFKCLQIDRCIKV